MNTGYLVLGAISEGCAEKIKKNLQNPIMNVLIPKGLAHSAPEVRGAAINALCYFSEHLIPDIFEYHAVIIPNMVTHIADLSPKVVSKALIAIDVFFDGMDPDDIHQYLPLVIPKLVQVLVNPHSTPLMKAASMSAIGSAATVA
jgi:vesicle coat complex subunit